MAQINNCSGRPILENVFAWCRPGEVNTPRPKTAGILELCPESSAKWIMVAAVVGPVGNAERCPPGKLVGSSRHAQDLLLVLS
jgi:hypothetical protein